MFLWIKLMKIIYSEKHNRHAPPYQFLGGRMAPYPEVPERAERILQALNARGVAEVVFPRAFSPDAVRAVHDPGYLHYLEHAYAAWVDAGGTSEAGLTPDTFAMRSLKGKPDTLIHQAGYYCFETQTPILEGTYGAAWASAGCALTGADLLLEGERAAYALCRPPGHHAGRDVYGGYCYLNNAAIAAMRLSREGRVAILDIDFHHGNGTQDIFYDSNEALFVSIHADPNRKYPYFSGFADEQGQGEGRGFTRNFPLEAGVDEARYLEVLNLALDAIRAFEPAFIVVSLGVDIYQGDPLGDFELSVEAFTRIGERLGQTALPALLVQEGGYDLETVGVCVGNVLQALDRTEQEPCSVR